MELKQKKNITKWYLQSEKKTPTKKTPFLENKTRKKVKTDEKEMQEIEKELFVAFPALLIELYANWCHIHGAIDSIDHLQYKVVNASVKSIS